MSEFKYCINKYCFEIKFSSEKTMVKYCIISREGYLIESIFADSYVCVEGTLMFFVKINNVDSLIVSIQISMKNIEYGDNYAI